MPTRYVKVTKVKDTRFEGNHPNGIYEGYAYMGFEQAEPEVGLPYCVGGFHTSAVEEIIDESTIKTRNSIYKIEVRENPFK